MAEDIIPWGRRTRFPAAICYTLIMTSVTTAMAIGLTALLVNVPLGRLRARSRTYSTAWFLCVHLSVPFIIGLRIASHVSLWAIPAFIACAVCGQVLGGRSAPREPTGSS